VRWSRPAGSRLPAALALLLACASPPAGGPVQRVTVPPGATLTTIADSLKAHGLISSTLWFRTLGRVRGIDRRIQAGIYDLPAGATSWVLLDRVASGKVATARITVPEGLSLFDLADLARREYQIPAESLMAAARDSGLRARLGVTAPSLEGFLLPETYTLPLPVTARKLVTAMAEGFERAWRPAWDRRVEALGLTRIELVALASIVEGEARHDDERATIAGVYVNRLRRGMLLQADPTIQYAIRLATGARKNRLYFKDYAFASAYNTYLHTGLPPGPVNSPGLPSVLASLYPAQVPYLYFVAGPDGHHLFSRSLVEHNDAIRRLRRGH
jgi:peptidoglycan lytic transglycosylase G